MREILIVVFGRKEFTGDHDNSNFNSIMGTKPDWSGWKVKSAKQRTYVIFFFFKNFIVKGGREIGQLLEGRAWSQGKDFMLRTMIMIITIVVTVITTTIY